MLQLACDMQLCSRQLAQVKCLPGVHMDGGANFPHLSYADKLQMNGADELGCMGRLTSRGLIFFNK
jgi:hypothetical protein